MRFREFSGWVNTQRCWEDGAPREGMEAACSTPITSRLSGFPWVVFFSNKWVIISKVLS